MAVSEAKVLAGAGQEGQVGVAAFGAGVGGVDQVAGRGDLHRHVGEHELHALEVADRLAELLALLGVRDGGVERSLGDADRLRADHRAGVVEGLEGRAEAGALLADEPVGRDPAVVEVDLAGRRALDAELALLGADAEPGVVLVHDERRDALGALARVGAGHHGEVRVHRRPGDPHLGAVEDVGVAVAHGPGPHRRGVGAGFALGQRVGEHGLAGGDLRQVAALELLAAGQDEPHRAELVDGDDERTRGADPGDLLHDDRVRDPVGAGAAVLLRDVDGQQIGPPELLVHVPRILGRLVDLGRPRGDLVLGELTHGLAQELVLLGERVQGVGGVAGAHADKRRPAEPVGHEQILIPMSGSSSSSRVGDRPWPIASDAMTTRPRSTVIGTGYLGATHAVCMASLGFEVLGLDVLPDKVEALQSGVVPFFEPGLQELLVEQLGSGRLRFTTSFEEVGVFGDVHFVCVGTPQKKGEYAADLSYVDRAFSALLPHARPGTLLVGKSTVPAGTAERLSAQVAAARGDDVGLAWNPEFLREGFAVEDTLRPDRLVFGVSTGAAGVQAEQQLRAAFAPVIDRPDGGTTPVVVTDLSTAQLVKVAANAFLATKISFINAMAEVCEATGGDVTMLSKALSFDSRIGGRFLNAGLGFGGGCLPKDIRAFMARAGELGVDQALSFLKEVDAINLRRRARMVDLAREELDGSFGGMRVAVLGAAFKPDSDDIRDSPALDVASTMQRQGAAVCVYDPAAMDNARVKYPELGYRDSVTDAAKGADLVLLLTEWAEFKALDPAELAGVVSERRILDGRNALDPALWRRAVNDLRGWSELALQHIQRMRRERRIGAASRVPVRGNRAQLRALYRRMVRLSVRRGVQHQASHTPYEWSRRLRNEVPTVAEETQAFTDAYVAAEYGPAPPSKDEIHQARRWWRRIERVLLRRR
jgi:UDPglucose 6-dehydrogenase